MNGTLLMWAILYAQVALGLSVCLALYRVLHGPRAQDRMLGLDTIYACIMLFFLVTGMQLASDYLFEGALIIATMGFAATVALAKFLLRGEVIE